MASFAEYEQGYEDNWANIEIRPNRLADVQKQAKLLLAGKDTYVTIQGKTGVPWWFIGLCHYRESNFNFNTYLGNGQALDKVTTIVPKGRGPFLGPDAFVNGAVDALRLQGFTGATDWSIARVLYRLEGFNGYGYHGFGVNSPYLYGGSTLYGPPEAKGGKYVADHDFNPNVVDTQLGTAVILKELLELDTSIVIPSSSATQPSQPDDEAVGSVLWVQQSLNKLGAKPPLAEDGISGPATMGAVSAFQQKNNLPDTGLADAATIAAIQQELSASTLAAASALSQRVAALTGAAAVQALPLPGAVADIAGAANDVRQAAIMPDDDPASPRTGEISETADLATARMLANLGVPTVSEPAALEAPSAAPAGQPTLLSLDFSKAQAFLKACMTSNPRVTYGLGKKVPFLNAVPGKDFKQVDCSGFVREAVREASNPTLAFPDGSVVQHDWVQAHQFEKTTVADGTQDDGIMRIAFLRPQDVSSGIGHVVLIVAGKTLESHGGTGPDSRTWDGSSWQAKTFVYNFARDAQFDAVVAAPQAMAVAPQASAGGAFTVRQGHRYRATIALSGIEQFASNDYIANELTQYGFADVVVTGSGGTRVAEGTWTGPDTTAQIDPHITNIVEIPVAAPAAAAVVSGAVSVPAPAVITRGGAGVPPRPIVPPRASTGAAMSNAFTAAALPMHHDAMLVVKIREQSLSSAAPLSVSAMNDASAPALSTGFSALSFYERAGMIKQVLPLRREVEHVTRAPGISAVSALTFAFDAPRGQSDPHSGINFIELDRNQNPDQLQTALANDPNVLSVSKVPVRYLLGKTPKRTPAKRAAASGATIAAVPPRVPIMWNLMKIAWDKARAQTGFRDADLIKVAVLDTGVDQSHPELHGQVAAYDCQAPDQTTPVSDKDIIGHGTHVSGTIAAIIDSSVGVKGICKCQLSVWKIFADTATFEPALGSYIYTVNPVMYRRALLECVDNPVDVMNLSIGGTAPPDPTSEGYLFEQLLASGVTICAAMGNDRASGSPTFYPAAIPGVIAVGATGLDDVVTSFSNSGQHIAVSAPGKAIWSTLPTYPGQTGFQAVYGANGQLQQGAPASREMNYDAWDGTSMATPHVTASAALLLAKNNSGGKQMTPDQVKKMLMQSADKVPQMKGSNFTIDYGAGRLDLLTLLQQNPGP